ncbi:hypothetical protein EWB00_008439 [Schistosoma japonicum]|uniref:Uncharacterized protein n=1 Tax=Schistosoma japonicum TaxID=6182 RepID=A0A4Z2CQ90_SCHJA|nr:hypothetical protein EWB00_008439 [Schistosoma japonicum]
MPIIQTFVPLRTIIDTDDWEVTDHFSELHMFVVLSPIKGTSKTQMPEFKYVIQIRLSCSNPDLVWNITSGFANCCSNATIHLTQLTIVFFMVEKDIHNAHTIDEFRSCHINLTQHRYHRGL